MNFRHRSLSALLWIPRVVSDLFGIFTWSQKRLLGATPNAGQCWPPGTTCISKTANCLWRLRKDAKDEFWPKTACLAKVDSIVLLKMQSLRKTSKTDIIFHNARHKTLKSRSKIHKRRIILI
ncbi:hypothetical protein C8R43DRAFT_1033862, partial [Mycena crocata]